MADCRRRPIAGRRFAFAGVAMLFQPLRRIRAGDPGFREMPGKFSFPFVVFARVLVPIREIIL